MYSKMKATFALAVLTAHGIDAQAVITSTQAINLPTARPKLAFNVPGNFPSVGFELAFLPGYDNEFSGNMIAEMAKRMEEKPLLRIGGTSGDIIKYNPNQKVPADCLENDDVNQCSHKSKFILGPHYFDALNKRFKGARVSIQAPLDPIHGENPPNKTNVVEFIKEAYKSIGADRIDAIALGNEVNFYEPNAKGYVKDALAAAEAIKSAVDVDNDTIWEVINTASGGVQGSNPAPYTVEQIFKAGINKDKRVKYVAEHYYQFDGKSLGIAEHLLNHTDLKTKFAKYKPSINYALNKAGTGYIFSETGGPLAIKEEKTTYFANTLWAVNFMLYSMSNGVQRVSLVQRPVAKRALWIPLPGLSTPGPRVQAPFYAMPFITDFLGKEVSGDRGAINIDSKNPKLTAYAMYEGDKIARVAIVNLRQYAGEGERSAMKVRLQNLDGKGKSVSVGRLHADKGTAAGGWDMNKKNITWSGEAWSYQVSMGKAHGKVVSDTVSVVDGVAEIVVPDSEAVIAYLDI